MSARVPPAPRPKTKAGSVLAAVHDDTRLEASSENERYSGIQITAILLRMVTRKKAILSTTRLRCLSLHTPHQSLTGNVTVKAASSNRPLTGGSLLCRTTGPKCHAAALGHGKPGYTLSCRSEVVFRAAAPVISIKSLLFISCESCRYH